MDDILIDVVYLELFEGELECLLSVLDLCARDFGGYVELFAGNAGLFDRYAQFSFVAVG